MKNKKRLLNSPLYTSQRHWLDMFFEQAAPQYENAFYAFMALVKNRSDGPHTIESNGLYEALDATINFLAYFPMLKIFAGEYVPPPILEFITEIKDKLEPKLLDIHSRCIEQDGVICIPPDDLAILIKIVVNFINDLASLVSKKVQELVEPFNEFIKDFDETIKIDLVDGEYHFLIMEESEKRKEQINQLNKKLYKNNAQQHASVQKQQSPQVFVIYDKKDIVDYIQQRWLDEIILTNDGAESLLDSGFKDIKQIVTVFDLLANKYHKVYSNKLRMDDAMEATNAVGIEFKPSMSDTTMGNHPIYQRKYNNRPADFNRHLCMGTSRRPEHCMRIHFEWDETQNKIVIHHAGNHLPCSN